MDKIWDTYTDPKTNTIFYHNRKTGVSLWELPTAEAVVKEERKEEEKGTKQPLVRIDDDLEVDSLLAEFTNLKFTIQKGTATS